MEDVVKPAVDDRKSSATASGTDGTVDSTDRLLRALGAVEGGPDHCRSVEDMAAAACWSSYHFTRIFAATLGMPPGLYLRRRRLSQAATALITSDQRVIDIALDAGFESQEALTRAFQSMFGLPPARFRRTHGAPGSAVEKQSDGQLQLLSQNPVTRDHLDHLLRGAVVMTPEIRTKEAFTVIGLGAEFVPPETEHLTELWHTFNEKIPALVGEYPNLAFGVMNSLVRDNPTDDSLHYTAAVKVADDAPVPEGMERIEIPASKYAVFIHKGHVSEFENTLEFIWKTWAAQNGARLANAPDFELYDERFNAETLSGEVEIWIPLKD